MDTKSNRSALAAFLLAISAGYSATALATTVFTETNSAGGNAIQILRSGRDGVLQLSDKVATGGAGTDAGLGSQGALAMSRHGRWLYAVNAGSNEISVFAVSAGGIRLVDKIASGGETPISVTVFDDLVYVLNAGGNGNISGFRRQPNGHLLPLAGSTKALSSAAASPAQIAFDREGTTLVVTEKASARILTYALDADGRPADPLVNPSSGATPFGFAIDRRNTLLVSEAFGGAANASALSSYEIGEPNAPLQLISGSVASHQTAACWVALARHDRYAYTANTGSGTVTGYRISRAGEIATLSADGVSGITGGGPTDAVTDRDGDTLFVLSPPIGQVVTFSVRIDGSLIKLGSTAGLPATAAGLIAY